MMKTRTVIYYTTRYYNISQLRADLSVPERNFIQDKNIIAAELYNTWFTKKSCIMFSSLELKPTFTCTEISNAIELKTEFTRWIPNIIRCFLTVDRDEYKDNIKTIINKGFFDIKDHENNNIFHLLAIESSQNSANNINIRTFIEI